MALIPLYLNYFGWNSLSLGTALSKIPALFSSLYLCIVKSSKLKPFILLGSAIALASCSSAPQQVAPVKRAPVVQPIVEAEEEVEVVKIEKPLSGADFIEQAGQQQGSEQQWQLLEAAKAHLQQGEIEQALAISRVLAQQAAPEVQQANLLAFFQGLVAAGDHEDIEKFSSQYSLSSLRDEDKAVYLQSLAEYQSSRREPDKAVKTYLQLLALQPEQSSHQSALWQQLGMLTPDQLENLRQSSDPTTQGWAQLLQLHQQHLGNTPALTQAISDWQQQYPNLPSLQQLPAEIQQLSAVDAFSPQTIAVLLPFSSNFRQHAEAIQQGILAASANQEARLIFIDSQTETSALKQQLATEQRVAVLDLVAAVNYRFVALLAAQEQLQLEQQAEQLVGMVPALVCQREPGVLVELGVEQEAAVVVGAGAVGGRRRVGAAADQADQQPQRVDHGAQADGQRQPSVRQVGHKHQVQQLGQHRDETVQGSFWATEEWRRIKGWVHDHMHEDFKPKLFSLYDLLLDWLEPYNSCQHSTGLMSIR